MKKELSLMFKVKYEENEIEQGIYKVHKRQLKVHFRRKDRIL